MIRPLEPRVGENRPIRVIKAEAEAFLREMFAEGLIPSTKDFEQRLNKVMVEIEENGIDCMVREDTAGDGELERRKVPGRSSNGYVHTKEELEYGVRVSWRNSRKCIMRAHCWDLKFVDLRSVKTSRGMLEATIGNALAAYNGGRIVPTGKFPLGHHWGTTS
jgi:nitric oxide synthase oxygenase domain/subunit